MQSAAVKGTNPDDDDDGVLLTVQRREVLFLS